MIMRKTQKSIGFTLIETMVAISLLLLAVIEPMTLTAQSLMSAYYARDQMTASNLAQEAIEAVRAARDANILFIATCNPKVQNCSRDVFEGIPHDPSDAFTVDTTTDGSIRSCGGVCPALQTNGTLYGYTSPRGGLTGGTITDTTFVRTVHACYIQLGGGCAGTPVTDEVRLRVDVTWRTGSYPTRTITIYENLYRWI